MYRKTLSTLLTVTCLLCSNVQAMEAIYPKSLELPRCRNDFKEIPVLERLAMTTESAEEWTPYRLTGQDGRCAYQTVTYNRMNSCMADRWLITIGGSHQAINAHSLIQMLLGISRAESMYNFELDEDWKSSYEQEHLNLILDFSTPYRKTVCQGKLCIPPLSAHTPGHGYFSSIHGRFLSSIIDGLEVIKANFFTKAGMSLPVPNIFIMTDYWIAQCYYNHKNPYHWSAEGCHREIYKELKFVTNETIIRHQVNQYHRILAYIRDAWPHVKSIMQEKREFMHLLEPHFPPEVLLDNGYPDIIWVTDHIEFDRKVEGRMRQGKHLMGRIPVMKNLRLLDSMCSAHQTQTIKPSNSIVYFAPNCTVYPDKEFWYTFPCHHRFSSQTIQNHVLVNNSKIKIDQALSPSRKGGHIRLTESDSSYHFYLVRCSAIFLVLAAFWQMRTFCLEKIQNWRKSDFTSSLKTPMLDLVEAAENTELKTPSTPSKTRANQFRTARLDALGVARYIASCHVVIGHLTSGFSIKNGFHAHPAPAWRINSWGFSWVPFFMMLSGFVLAYARLNSCNPAKTEHWFAFTWKRIMSIYPLFLCGLLIRAGQISALTGVNLSLGTPFETTALLFLAQAWFPQVAVQGMQAHCWFLSCIVPYWAAHQQVFSYLRSCRTKTLWILAFLTPVLPMIGLLLVPTYLGYPVEWYVEWDGWSLNSEMNYLAAILKFHPLCYFHIYAFGIIAAILMNRMNEHNKWVQKILENGAAIGLLGLLFVFLSPASFRVPVHKLSCRLGFLAPLHGLYLIGLSLQIDPVARFFSLKMFRPLENLSFPQYIFQFIAYFSWQAKVGFGFWCWLTALSAAAFFFVQAPFKNAKGHAKFRIQAAAQGFGIFWVVVFISSTCRSDILLQNDVFNSRKLQFANGVWDFNLSPNLLKLTSSRKDFKYIINPSILWIPEYQRLYIAARAHRYVRSSFEDREVIKWNSDVIVGQLDPETFEPVGNFTLPFPKKETGWTQCENSPYHFHEKNATFSKLIATGPEDPRLVHRENQLLLSTNLMSPALIRSKRSMKIQGQCNTGGRMILKSIALDTNISSRPRLLETPTSLRDVVEKNWLAFEAQGSLNFIQQMHPFTVVRRTSYSSQAERFTTRAISTRIDPVLQKLNEKHDLKFHGGANPIAMSLTTEEKLIWPPIEGFPTVYVGIFHTLSKNYEYVNYLFQFSFSEATKSWDIDRVSRRLNLLEHPLTAHSGATRPMTFASGITATESGIYISYGSSNVQARLRFLPWHVFQAQF